MSTVLALAGKIASGKSTLALNFAEAVGWPHVSFGDYVRGVARQQGRQETRDVLQEIGDKFIREDLEGFCRSVLAQADWKAGQPLVIEGVRHAEVSNLLRRLVAPSKYFLVLVSVDDQTRKARLRQEGIDDRDVVERVEAHPTEEQIKTVLPHIADYNLKGTDPIPVLINKLKAISSDEPHEAVIPTNDANVLEVIETIRRLTPSEQWEVLARLWSEPRGGERVLETVRFDNTLRVVAYAPEQERYLGELRELLLRGVPARLENESDGNYEVYGPDRTYYVTMTPTRQFAALLSSWTPDSAPREVSLQGAK
jgi:dephospho-CoA kinase